MTIPKTTLSFYLHIAVVAAIVFAIGSYFLSSQNANGTHNISSKESTYDRVMRTKTLRCGFATWYPNMVIDPNTGQKSGSSFDVMNKIGEILNLKVEWAQEAGFGTAEQDLLNGRYDALCADVCFEAKRTKFTYFSRPFVQSPLYIIGRNGDHRFDNDWSIANSGDIKAGVLRNTILEHLANRLVPKATQVDISELGADTDVMLALAAKKIDISFNNLISVDRYNAKNPGSAKTIGKPVGTCYSGFMLPHGDQKLKYMIDGAINEMIAEGSIAPIYKKYLPDDPRYWQVPQGDMFSKNDFNNK
ncbi:MAG: amino acid ABC transporter substrate-binding protein [Alphaproteobacteria bacterium]|nr:MAG: amino acid ABC transporter substrate-binding protein [Alphaproteobacteria bacterium]